MNELNQDLPVINERLGYVGKQVEQLSNDVKAVGPLVRDETTRQTQEMRQRLDRIEAQAERIGTRGERVPPGSIPGDR